ncbi:MAG: hypothetical protein VKS61_11475 [Candidatus Sericytochromatia bacterium]|nr:hypothetical protein [Candidatus Sericytochromatia bacterium]
MLLTPIAATVLIPPPAYADERRTVWLAGAGWGVPEGTHVAFAARAGALGARITMGTQASAQATFTGAGRYFLPAPLAGGFIGAGAALEAGSSLQQALAFLDAGWQLRSGPWLLEVAAGPAPFAWGSDPLAQMLGGLAGAPRLQATAYWRF